jgi:hypothetical protein
MKESPELPRILERWSFNCDLENNYRYFVRSRDFSIHILDHEPHIGQTLLECLYCSWNFADLCEVIKLVKYRRSIWIAFDCFVITPFLVTSWFFVF